MSKKVKIFAIVLGIIIVLIVLFSYIGSNSASPAPVASTNGLSTSAAATTAIPGGGSAVTPGLDANNFSSLLSSISSITLNTSIFSDAGYKALRDYPITLGTAIIGRQNPFAPMGTDIGGSQTGTAITVQTLTPSKVLTTSAEFGALVSAQSTSPSTVVFQYGTNDTVSSASSPVTVTKSGTALFTITGLTPGTTYYVKAVAVQGSTTATGTLMSFTTAGTQPH